MSFRSWGFKFVYKAAVVFLDDGDVLVGHIGGLLLAHHLNKACLGASQRYFVVENPVFYRVAQRSVLLNEDFLASYKSHLHHTLAKRSVTQNFDNHATFASLYV